MELLHPLQIGTKAAHVGQEAAKELLEISRCAFLTPESGWPRRRRRSFVEMVPHS